MALVTRPRPQLPVALAAAIVAVGLTAAGVADAARRQPRPSDGELMIEAEIDAMLDRGMSADDPKVVMLEDAADELRAGSASPPPREPEVDTGRQLADAKAAAGAERPSGASATTDAGRRTGTGTAAAWQTGAVECEPVPQLLSAAELAGAVCVSVPQPDGSNRYVAVAGDGTVRVVAFGADGAVSRQADQHVALGPGGASSVTALTGGDVAVAASGQAPVTVDLR